VLTSDKLEFAKILHEMAKHYNRQLSELIVEAYWRELSGLSIDVMRDAVIAAIGVERFLPTGRKILEHADDKPPPPDGKLLIGEGECQYCRGTVTIPYFSGGYVISGRCTFCSRSKEIVTRIRDGRSYKEHRWAHGLMPWAKATGRENPGTYEQEWAKVQVEETRYLEANRK
jgi:hypothetical protein